MNSPDTNIKNAPDYIKELVAEPAPEDAAGLLFDGSWCGHGEELYRIYDIIENNNKVFRLHLPYAESEELSPTAVVIVSTATESKYLIYDSRQHPSSLYSHPDYSEVELQITGSCVCNECEGENFRIAVGFEIPVDSTTTNDTSWFVLATECVQCGAKSICFEDETA